MLIAAAVDCLMRGRKRANAPALVGLAGLGVGHGDAGSRPGPGRRYRLRRDLVRRDRQIGDMVGVELRR